MIGNFASEGARTSLDAQSSDGGSQCIKRYKEGL